MPPRVLASGPKPYWGKTNYQNLSGSCNENHNKKAERETKGERGVNFDTFVGPTSS